MRSNRLLKNAPAYPCLPVGRGRHLRRCPTASPSQRRGNESLLIRRDATLIPCSLGEFILSLSKDEPCICLREAASAKAGAFLSSL